MGNYKIVDGPDDGSAEYAHRLFHQVEADTMTAVKALQASGNHEAPAHLYLMLTAAAGAMQLAAKVMTMPESLDEMEDWTQNPPSRTAILAAALLMVRCFLPESDGFTFEFNPINVRAALDATKKVSNTVDLSNMTKNMVTAANKQVSPLDFFDNSRDKNVMGFGSHRLH